MERLDEDKNGELVAQELVQVIRHLHHRRMMQDRQGRKGPRGQGRNDRPERPDQPERPDRPDRPERPQRPSCKESCDRPDRPARPDRPQRPERPDQPERPERFDGEDVDGRRAEMALKAANGLLARFDRNKDGKLAGDELKAFAFMLHQAFGPRQAGNNGNGVGGRRGHMGGRTRRPAQSPGTGLDE